MSERPGFWIKSSWSFANGNCIEVAQLPGGQVGVRDSKNPDGPIVRFTRGAWSAFVAGVRASEFNNQG